MSAFGGIFAIDSYTVLGICGGEKFGKELGLKTTTINGPRGELNFAFIRRNRNVGSYSLV